MITKYAGMLTALLGVHLFVAAQTEIKKITALRSGTVFRIDGNLNELEWKTAPVAGKFIELRPNTFRKEDEANRTEIYILYNNQGIYFGGYCHEKNKDSIATELVGRDNFGSNDFIGVVLDTYLDKLNGFEYFVTPLGEQMDAKVIPQDNNGNSEDFSWNSVWQSASKLQADGWSFEMFLPYSALRFSKKDVQTWGLNIVRRRNKSGQQLFWNPIDPKVNGFLTQEGILTIPDKISPPVRLSFSPYFSTYVNNYPYNSTGVKNTTNAFNGGMDIKYGINESFTLDATLVPDFGQTQSDNRVLNLTPFEVKYNENRTFFTEGTELFNKGNLFYSRRIGATPIHYGDVSGMLDSTQHIDKNPTETKLLNAIKISGRNKNKLGIGFFNAITQPMYATIQNDKGQKQQILTNPLTNYNILVLDQSLKNNSSVTLVNSNVMRNGKDYDANVTAALLNLYDKKNKWNLNANAYSSTIFGNTNTTGYKYGAGLGKVSGSFNFSTMVQVVDDKFNPNDMGIQFYNNNINESFFAGYAITKPTQWFNRLFNNFNFNYDQLFVPRAYQSLKFNYNSHLQLKNLWWIGLFTNASLKGNDFYEPRVNGRVFKSPAYFTQGAFVESNSAKKYSISLVAMVGNTFLFNSKELYVEFTQSMRFNNKFSITHYINLNPISNNIGFPTSNGSNGLDGIYTNEILLFGRRSRTTVENRLNFKYSFNNKMYITMRVRHYLGTVTYKEFFILNQAGTLDAIPDGSTAIKQYISTNHNFNNNYNTFNVDMVYSWRFAPGSEFNIVWKNDINTYERDVINGYFKNFNSAIAAPQSNSISVKILYYIDYLQLHKAK
ncbi:DUF5916 domain-containing protein [Ferruginibacter sp.]|uniref:DUF5916 domain-containing protein n=1 Tax=Ferruginibacter sp. TaxID=1940288 RepID=UPI0019A607AA|nr:DUF5916 domain-containing protein [Ferruginibacter sp.]MBC7629157.1 carbohydrate binding family 9 domain-containing protein [Ferruginibacter sp.]